MPTLIRQVVHLAALSGMVTIKIAGKQLGLMRLEPAVNARIDAVPEVLRISMPGATAADLQS